MLTCTVIFAVMEKGSSEGYTQGITIFETLGQIRGMDIVSPANWVYNLFTGQTFEWGAAIIDAALFNYAMFESGPWQLVKWFFWAIGLAWVVSLIVTLMRGAASA